MQNCGMLQSCDSTITMVPNPPQMPTQPVADYTPGNCDPGCCCAYPDPAGDPMNDPMMGD